MSVRGRLALVTGVVALLGAGCGSDDPPGATVATPPAVERDGLDEQIDALAAERRAAAAAGDRPRVATLEARLDALAARRSPEPLEGPAAQSPFERYLAAFPFKGGPLYVEQLSPSRDGRTLLVSVDVAAFCLRPEARRRAAVGTVARTAREALERPGAPALRLVVTPLADTGPDADAALATAEGEDVRLEPDACA